MDSKSRVRKGRRRKKGRDMRGLKGDLVDTLKTYNYIVVYEEDVYNYLHTVSQDLNNRNGDPRS